MNDLRHLSRDEQKLLADVALLVKDDDQEFNYEMLKVHRARRGQRRILVSAWQKCSAPCRPTNP